MNGIVLQQDSWCLLTLETNTQRAGNLRPRPGPPLHPGWWPGVWARGQDDLGLLHGASSWPARTPAGPLPLPIPIPRGGCPSSELWYFKCQTKEVPLPLPCSCFTPSYALAFPLLRNCNTTLKKNNSSPVTGVKEKAGPWREWEALKWRE